MSVAFDVTRQRMYVEPKAPEVRPGSVWSFDWVIMNLGLGNCLAVDGGPIAPVDTTRLWLQPASPSTAGNGVLKVFSGGAWTAMTPALFKGHVGSPSWGGITGTLTNQADLNSALGGKAPLASPAFTGAPTAPTASAGTSTTQIATTAFVSAAVAALVNGAPGALDVLSELAAAMGNDPNFATTVTNAIAGKQPLDATLTALAGVTVAADKVIYAFGADAFTTTDLTAAGRSMIGSADAAAQTALLNAFTSGLKGLAPASGGGTTNFLRADGTWAAPSVGGVAWGAISGSLVDQSDLNAALSARLTLSGGLMSGALGIVAGTAGAPAIHFSGDTNTGVYSPSADVLAVATGGVERVRISDAGDIVVGAMSAARRLHAALDDAVNNATSIVARLTHTTSGTPAAGIGTGLEFEVETSAGNNEVGAAVDAVTTAVGAGAEAFDLVFRLMTAGAVPTEAARIKAGGGLTVGTSSPITAGTIELGHASDTTVSRHSAGVIAVEGIPIYSNIPQNSKSAAYTAVLADAQTHILHPSADTTARTFTIPSNASVAFPIGSAITFVNQNGAGSVTIAITTDTMRLAGAGTTGSRTLAANGVATALKITSTEWIISGTGLT